MRVFVSQPVPATSGSLYKGFDAVMFEVIKHGEEAYRVNTLAERGETVQRFLGRDTLDTFEEAIEYIDHAIKFQLN